MVPGGTYSRKEEYVDGEYLAPERRVWNNTPVGGQEGSTPIILEASCEGRKGSSH
jgi:hypothetical protein